MICGEESASHYNQDQKPAKTQCGDMCSGKCLDLINN